jgi:hypothetical protein
MVVATAVLLAMVTQWQKKRKEATTPCLEPANLLTRFPSFADRNAQRQ